MKKLFFIAMLWLGAMAAKAQPGTYPVSCKQPRVAIDLGFSWFDYFKDSAAAADNFLNAWKEVDYIYVRDGIKLKPSIRKIHRTPDPYLILKTQDQKRYAFANDWYLKSDTGRFDVFAFVDRKSGQLNLSSWAPINGIINKWGSQFIYLCIPTYWGLDPTKKRYHETPHAIAHEIGHTLGSYHTQWCGWLHPDGTRHPIDSCTQAEKVDGSPACIWPRKESRNGTIMSQCQFDTKGEVDFNLGFGPLPGNVIRQTLARSSVPCVGSPPQSCTSWTYSPWTPCLNGTQTRTATGSPSGCAGVPPLPLIQSCEVVAPTMQDGVIGPVMHYSQNGQSFFRFAIPAGGNWQYEVSYCRYDGAMNPPDSITPAAACGIRNALNFSRPSAAQLAAGQINLQAISQPAERNKWYRIRVRYRNGATAPIQTKQSAWFWWP